MAVNDAQIRLAIAALSLSMLTSCGRVDHTQDLHQANEAFRHATGIQTRWAPVIDLQLLQPADDETVTLEQALTLALSNNRSLRADLETIAQNKADLVQAGLLSNPVLSIAGMLPEGGGRANLSFGLSKDFADLWLIPTRKRAARARLQQRVLIVADTAIALVNEVSANYYTLQYQFEAIELQEQNLKLLRDVIELTQARLTAGEASQLDLFLSRGRLLESELNLVQLRADSELTRQALLRLMGVANARDVWSPTRPDLNFIVLAADEVSIINAALQQRLDVQAAHWELESSLADFHQQELRVIPSLNIGGAGERLERRALPGRKILADTARASIAAGTLTAPQIESRAQRDQERRQIIDLILGPTIEMPLPIFDQNLAQMAKAQSRTRELLQRYEDAEQRVIEGVRSALTRRRLAEDRVRLFQESLLPVQVAGLDLARKAYQTGRESILTVLLAQEALIRTRVNYSASIRDLSTATASLERELSGRVSDAPSQPRATHPVAASQPAGVEVQLLPHSPPSFVGG